MATCLTPAEIEDYVAGAMPASQVPLAEAHFAQCDQCRVQLDYEHLFADVRAAWGPGGEKTPSGLDVESQRLEITDGSLAALPVIAEGYRVLGELHRGGQGVVYRAVQLATKRTVALKVLLAGTSASGQQRLRFEREVDIAASLRHPNIVTIYDSGCCEGLQYLAMEYVEGESLDRYVRGHTDSPPRRDSQPARIDAALTLFHKIAAAVGYAHTRGVIHRDLKPGNILVDAAGEPHVLDFGLAKLADSDSHSPGTAPTMVGEFLGTLAYASPEQTAGDPLRIDLRTDVYSLGVILFELLTGQLPYDISGPIAAAVQRLCEQPPQRPSLLCRAIDDELETIVLKSLAKEPARRYQTAEQLARDIGSYLAGEPIDAKRDSSWYLLRKTLTRYRATVATAAAFLVVVAVALLVSLASLRQALLDRGAAVLAGQAAQRATVAEAAQRKVAEAQRAEAEARRAEADAHRAEAEFQSYVANIAAAAAAVAGHDVVEAWERLDAAPERLRGWEWSRLVNELDGSFKSFAGHTSYVTHVALSPDGRWVASSGYEPGVRVWNARTGKQVTVIDSGERSVVSLHPDGGRLAVGDSDHGVRLWDWESREFVESLAGAEGNVDAMAFSPDGRRLAAALHTVKPPHAVTVLVWNLADGQRLQQFDFEGWIVSDLAFRPDGQALAVSQYSGVTLWDIESRRRIQQFHDRPASCVAFRPDGKVVASGGEDNRVSLWDAATGELLHSWDGHRGAVLSLVFNDDGKYLVSGSRDKTIRIWDTAAGTARVLAGHSWAVSDVAVSADGRRIASASWDLSVKLWGGIHQRRADLLESHSDRVTGVAFSSRNVCATASADQTIQLWDLRSRNKLATLTGHGAPVYSVAFSPDGRRLASCGWNGELRVWDPDDGRALANLAGHDPSSRVHSVAFAPHGRWLASGSSDNSVRIWDASSYEQLAVLTGHDDHIHSLAISADGSCLASAGHRTVKVWDCQSHLEIASFPRRMLQDDYSLAFHPNGRWVAAGSDVRTLTIWDIVEKRPLRVLNGHSDEIHAVAFSPDGTRLVSASFDGRVKVWEVESGREVATLGSYPDHAHTLAFSPDGYYLLAGLGNGMIKIWRGTPSKD